MMVAFLAVKMSSDGLKHVAGTGMFDLLLSLPFLSFPFLSLFYFIYLFLFLFL